MGVKNNPVAVRAALLLVLATASVVGIEGVSHATGTTVTVTPTHGPPGTYALVQGDFTAGLAGPVHVQFRDASGAITNFGLATAVPPCVIHDVCVFEKKIVIPLSAAHGIGTVWMYDLAQSGSTAFTVTSR